MAHDELIARGDIAVVSDIHGNLTAWEAVLADIEGRGIDTVVNLGDIVGKGPRGSACAALSRERCAVTVRGNWEEMLVGGTRDYPPLAWWRDELSDEDRGWLAGLPFSRDLEVDGMRIRFLHASAASVFTRVFSDHTDAEFAAMFENTAATGDGRTPDVVCYGDIHVAYWRSSEGRTLVNVGSVGNALDEPTAAYAILRVASERPEPVDVEFVRVPYDIESEIGWAARSGMPFLDAYATELRTARYSR